MIGVISGCLEDMAIISVRALRSTLGERMSLHFVYILLSSNRAVSLTNECLSVEGARHAGT